MPKIQRQKPMRLIAAKDVETERAVPNRVDDQVDGAADLDAVGSHWKAEEVPGQDSFHP